MPFLTAESDEMLVSELILHCRAWEITTNQIWANICQWRVTSSAWPASKWNHPLLFKKSSAFGWWNSENGWMSASGRQMFSFLSWVWSVLFSESVMEQMRQLERSKEQCLVFFISRQFTVNVADVLLTPPLSPHHFHPVHPPSPISNPCVLLPLLFLPCFSPAA